MLVYGSSMIKNRKVEYGIAIKHNDVGFGSRIAFHKKYP